MEATKSGAPVLRLKASLQPFTVLELQRLNIPAIEADLNKRLQQAPALLKFAPIVIQLPDIQVLFSDAQALLKSLRALLFIPVGLRCGKENEPLAHALGLPLVGDGSVVKTKKTPLTSIPKLIKTAVRSGQQVVNPDGDLIIMGNVGQGAEVLAAGSIHIHGTLYGRALAGIQGDKNASISCQKLEAELFSIAGEYQVSEDTDAQHWQKTCYIKMQDDHLVLQSV
jgi:septum site-determining protein MinC